MRIHTLAAALIASAALSGCIPAIVAGGAGTVMVAAQERSAGSAVDDTGIYFKIKDKFAQQDFKDLLANVDVKVVEGRVLLTGNVDKPDSQIEAVKLAWQVNGVHEVINEIQINDQAGIWNYTQDVWISAQVKSRCRYWCGRRLRTASRSATLT